MMCGPVPGRIRGAAVFLRMIKATICLSSLCEAAVRTARRRGQVVLVGAMAALGAGLLAPAPAWAAGNNFPVVNGNSGKCLDVNHSGTADYTNVDIYTCNGTGAQDWHFVPLRSSSLGTVYEVKNPNSQKCLDVYHSGTANYTNVDIYTCNNSNSQGWIPRGGALVSDLNLTSCLDVYHSGTADLTNVDLFNCNGTGAQAWSSYKLPPTPPRGWFACVVNTSSPPSCIRNSDPINVQFYEPGHPAREDITGDLRAQGWGDTICYDSSVHFDSGTGTLYSPDDVLATDVGGVATCGSGPRDHARFWASPDDQTVYIAASWETLGCTVHCVTDFNAGRNTLVTAVTTYLANHGIPYTVDYPGPYPAGNLQGVSYDGLVALIQVG